MAIEHLLRHPQPNIQSDSSTRRTALLVLSNITSWFPHPHHISGFFHWPNGKIVSSIPSQVSTKPQGCQRLRQLQEKRHVLTASHHSETNESRKRNRLVRPVSGEHAEKWNRPFDDRQVRGSSACWVSSEAKGHWSPVGGIGWRSVQARLRVRTSVAATCESLPDQN